MKEPLYVPTHSNLCWSLEADLNDDVIREICHLMLSNRNGDAFTPTHFEPVGTVDQLALDAAKLADAGFSDIKIREYAWQQKDAKKAYLIMAAVRGTLIAHGALISRDEKPDRIELPEAFHD